jgi:hypothetical protein
MEIEKKLTGKFKPYYHHTTEQFVGWLTKQGYQFSFNENAAGDATITVKFENDGQFNQAAAKAEEFETGNDPQTTLDLGPEWPDDGEYKGTVRESGEEASENRRTSVEELAKQVREEIAKHPGVKIDAEGITINVDDVEYFGEQA